tara:strand:+ start:23358 stop:23561 length:204 start_codon:yes stop_codon:yes gene_type:complete
MSDEEAHAVLAEMDLPPKRIESLTEYNLGWLRRNVWIRNGNHPRCAALMMWLRERMADFSATDGVES